MIFITVLLGLLAYTYYWHQLFRQQTLMQKEFMKQQVRTSLAIIEAEERERIRIARDLHDGIGQMMSAARMNLSALENRVSFKDHSQKQDYDKIMNLIDESCRELRNVSHNMIPTAVLKSGLAIATREFTNQINSDVLRINLHTEGLEERLEGLAETILYRIVQECVSNVLRHAEATQLDVSLIRDRDGISATIEDNGKGFDIHEDAVNQGIGINNIRRRVEYLNGTVEWNTARGTGTLVAIHIPLAS